MLAGVMGPRDVGSAFNTEAPNELECSMLAWELKEHFKKSPLNTDALREAFKEGGYTQVSELKLAPAERVVQLLHTSGMGEGAMNALGILVGTLDSPFRWKSGVEEAAVNWGEKSVKGGRMTEVAQQRETRRDPITEYDLPWWFDGVIPGSSVFCNLLAREVPHTLPSLSLSLCLCSCMCVCVCACVCVCMCVLVCILFLCVGIGVCVSV